ncbi:unnamed protein product [Musa hybrid cultivar]
MTAFHALRVSRHVLLNRAHMLLYSLAILALLRHRLSCLLSSSRFLPLLLAELVLALMWVGSQATRWRPVRRHEFPDRLLREVDPAAFPALDVFICTADPHREPPISVVSTALSAMAFDYPPDRLSIYVSDDGGSAVTLFALMEASRFARYWLPFCKENGLLDRSPEAYFRSNIGGDSDKMKVMYESTKEKVETAMERGYVGNDVVFGAEERELFEKWKEFTRHDHPSVIQVLLQSSKDSDIMGTALPNLIYISREKRPSSHHHFKAGALNVLTRVSSAMSNAPVILTLDCDMYCNNPRAPLHALCYFLDPVVSADLAYVQFPQCFHGINENDIYASEIKRLFKINPRGMDGLRGPNYVGTGCFFSRRSLHSTGLPAHRGPSVSESALQKAVEAAACSFELGTKWGSSIGFRYGSLVEDFHTGYRLHCEGWKSVFCDPARPAFLGDGPKNLNDVLSQCKRWCVGLYEVAFSRFNPLTFGTTKASFSMGLIYAHYAFWGTWCVPITVYGLLPPLALMYRTPFFPKALSLSLSLSLRHGDVSDPWFFVYAYLFTAAYGQDLVEFLADGATIRRWWSDQRMWMTRGVTSCLFGTIQFGLNHIGISAPGFNVTSKVAEEEQNERYERGVLDLGVQSPFFVALGTVAAVNLSSLVVGIARAATTEGFLDEQFAQLFLSGFVAANCWPIYEAMFLRSDGGRMPRSVTVISLTVAGLLLYMGGQKMTAFHALQVSRHVLLNRAHMLLYSLAILALLRHRLSCLLSSSRFLPLLLAELVLAFMWVGSQATRWRPVRRHEFPDRLLREVDPAAFPALDVFICTADPHREPPISVVSTALSAMAFDYPPDRLSIYVSDDGGSAVTLFALMEASRFARYWLPFCKENGMLDRSPEAYFRSNIGGESDKMKVMYESMKEMVERAMETGSVGNDVVFDAEDRELFRKWKGFARHDHPSVIQVLLQSSKDSDIMGTALPNLIYVSREKRPSSHHHFKAGALNVLTRVSSAMSNAPVILTLDCDMYCNNPRAPLHALCYFLDPAVSADLAFVQFPQCFHGINENDIYASEFKREFRITPRGMDGLRGPTYAGTGCFFSRRSLHGTGSPAHHGSSASESALQKAVEAAACSFELGTKWGSSIGFRYGSLVEDFHTGFRLHCEGWKSAFCDPARPAFLGDGPKNLNDVLSQCKRWSVGLYEVAFSRFNPLTFGITKASFSMGLIYAHYACWGTWCVPITVYGLLPPLALLYQTPLFPKVSDPWFFVYAYLFTAAYGQDLVLFLADGSTIRRWWSDQRMWMTRGVTSFLFATIQFGLNHIGISAPGFNVTSKVTEEEQIERYKRGVLDLGTQSPFFVVLGTVAVVNLISLAVGITRAATSEGFLDEQFAQLFLSGFVAANCWPIYEAMVLRSDGGRMPRSVTVISLTVAGLLLYMGYLVYHV